ncbi:MAG: polysaccharide lyase 6 family protein [Bacilli bacterium]|nr:polysaccharide lyase 6 family protein [Bacilli bacterium]MBN2696760.1 polysaccharide lyase 6 family protein [Bacilli bacterium]
MKKLIVVLTICLVLLTGCSVQSTLPISSWVTTSPQTTTKNENTATLFTTTTVPIADSTVTTLTDTMTLPVTTTEMTPFEIVQHVKSNLELGVDTSDVRDNLVLLKEIQIGNDLVLISWESDNKNVINNEGHVVRPLAGNGDIVVTLTANFSLSGTLDYRDYVLTVKELPSSDLGLVEEVAAELIVWPEAKLNRDFLVLPRVGNFASKIEWETSDPDLIDLQGNVQLPEWGEPDQVVTLYSTISIGDAMVFRDYQITLTAKDPHDGIPITLSDDRILRIVPVSDKIALLTAVLNAEPGDAIVLESGNYYDVNFVMTRSGTKENPIFFLARDPRLSTIKGESTLHFKADHIIIANLAFSEGRPSSDQGVILLEGNYLRMTNILIDDFDQAGYDYKWVSLTGKYHEVDNNTFDGKETGGSLLTIWRDDLSPQFHNIHNNQFLNYQDAGGANGYETIRVGTSTYSQSDSYVVIENNRFESVNGEIEIISIKSGRVLVRGNTFIDSLGHVTCRHGKNNVIESNVFFGNSITDTGGIRAYDGGHVIRNNYVEAIFTSSNTRGGVVIHSGVNVPGTDTVLNAQWTSFDLLIVENTFVDCRQSILFDGKYSYPAHDPEFINNLIVAMPGYAAVRYDKVPIDAIFADNHFYSDTAYSGGGAVVSVSVPIGVEFQMTLPTLERDSSGLMLHPTWGARNLEVVNQEDSGVYWLRP